MRTRAVKILSFILSICLVFSLCSCSKYSGNYKDVQPLLDYICDNSQLKISNIDVLWREDTNWPFFKSDVSIMIEVPYSDERIPLEYIDELRTLINEYLISNKVFILNDGYKIFFGINNTYRDMGDWYYAGFSNFDNCNDYLYDGLDVMESYVYEKDFAYLSKKEQVTAFAPRFTELIDDTVYVEGLLNSLQENKNIEMLVLPEQCKEFGFEFSNDVEVIYE